MDLPDQQCSGSLACHGKGSEFAEGLGESETGFEYH